MSEWLRRLGFLTFVAMAVGPAFYQASYESIEGGRAGVFSLVTAAAGCWVGFTCARRRA